MATRNIVKSLWPLNIQLCVLLFCHLKGYYNTGYMSAGDQNSSGNDYYGFPMTVRSPTEQTQSLTTSNVDYLTDSFQSMGN